MGATPAKLGAGIDEIYDSLRLSRRETKRVAVTEPRGTAIVRSIARRSFLVEAYANTA